MNFTESKLEYFNNHWKYLKKIVNDIDNELPQIENNRVQKVSNYLHLIHYRDLENWDVSISGKSKKLKILCDKLKWMTLSKHDSIKIEPMLKRIIYKGLKKQSQPDPNGTSKFLGYGHFRWNYEAHVLNNEEINRIKEYFNL